MNNVVFLDIDGVMNTPKFIRENRLRVGEYEFFKDPFFNSIDEEKILLLNRLVENSKAEVVISSTWRRKGAKEINHVFKAKGFIGIITHITTLREMDRGLQILEFVNLHETTNYVVFDDEIFPIKNHITEKHIIEVDREKGLTDLDIEKALENMA